MISRTPKGAEMGGLRPRSTQSSLVIAALFVLAPLLLVASGGAGPKPAPLNKDSRREFIRAAQVWTPTPVAAMDLRAGPGGPGAFAPDAVVTCDYKPHEKRGGHSRKFDCAIDAHDVAKVRYGGDNGEVEGSVLASRLLWALGFGANRVYPVRVVCRGCSADPWTHPEPADGEVTFDPAAIDANRSATSWTSKARIRAGRGPSWRWWTRRGAEPRSPSAMR